MYGYKTDVSVLPYGLGIGYTKQYVGSVSDIDILRRNVEFNTYALRKRGNEEEDLECMGDLVTQYTGPWALRMDKEYQDLAEFLRAVLPKKKPIRVFLTLGDDRMSKKISSDRIIAEKYSGRLSILWTVMGYKYRWDERQYDRFFMACMPFTNIHVKWYPLRDEEGSALERYRKRLYSTGNDIATKLKRSQSEYRARRRACMVREFGSSELLEGAGAILDLLED